MVDAVGVDVGGSKLLGVRIDAQRPEHVVAEERLPTPAGADALVDAIVALVDSMGAPDDAAVGVGLPGLVDRSGRFRYGPNLPGVVDLPIAETLETALRRRVVIDNDATCATAAEFRIGAGAGHDDGLLLTIGTGIGAGIVIDGEVRRGASGFAGEPGHMVVDPAGPSCPCGRRGCWERFASGSGLGRLARDAATSGRLSDATARAGGATSVRGEHVVASARDGDDEAGAVLDEFARWLALGIGNLVDVLDPSIVVLGGGVMDAADVIVDRVIEVLPDHVMGAPFRPVVEIVPARAGERAGAVGAALLTSQAR